MNDAVGRVKERIEEARVLVRLVRLEADLVTASGGADVRLLRGLYHNSPRLLAALIADYLEAGVWRSLGQGPLLHRGLTTRLGRDLVRDLTGEVPGRLGSQPLEVAEPAVAAVAIAAAVAPVRWRLPRRRCLARLGSLAIAAVAPTCRQERDQQRQRRHQDDAFHCPSAGNQDRTSFIILCIPYI